MFFKNKSNSYEILLETTVQDRTRSMQKSLDRHTYPSTLQANKSTRTRRFLAKTPWATFSYFDYKNTTKQTRNTKKTPPGTHFPDIVIIAKS
jgi:hypothetical protein